MTDHPRSPCRSCRQEFPRYYLSAGRCDACHWDVYIPPDYESREEYRREEPWRHKNATRRPPLEVPFLDAATPRVADTAMRCRRKPRF